MECFVLISFISEVGSRSSQKQARIVEKRTFFFGGGGDFSN